MANGIPLPRRIKVYWPKWEPTPSIRFRSSERNDLNSRQDLPSQYPLDTSSGLW